MATELIRNDAPPLSQQLGEARARYAEAIRKLMEATAYYEQTMPEADEFCELVPDECQRALILQRAIQDCAYWDAESSAAEIRLARLGRIALRFHMDEKPAKQEDLTSR